MGLDEDIKQPKWKNNFSKAIVNLHFTTNWVIEKQHQLFKPFGLTLPQYNVLRILRGQHPSPSTVNLIIERMLDRMSNASRIIDKLEQKKLVLRKQCKEDRRAVDVLISEKGLALLDEMDTAMSYWEESFCNLSETESAQLNKLLDKFRNNG